MSKKPIGADKPPARQKLERFSHQISLTLSDGERTLPLGVANIQWKAPPGSTLSSSQLFMAAVLGAQRRYSATIKGLGLRYLWQIADDAGNRVTLLEIDQRHMEAKDKKEPLTIKRLGFDSVEIV
ncbi:hypothetical protein ACPRNU_19120 [Chromobacterium vaccinii]|uniref:hypothetical protein n=2 Tax=Chromobacteriaceae TaxID=1499392 RepID=UPI003C7587C2